MTARTLQRIREHLAQLQSARSAREVKVEQAGTAQAILDRIRDAAEGEFIVVVGHNEDGVLKLPSGDSIEVARLSDALSAKGLKGIVLTCESIRCIRESTDNEVVTNRKLRFDEMACALAGALTAFIADATCGCSDNILRELSKELTKCFNATEARFKIMVTAIGTAVVSATIVELVDIGQGHETGGLMPATTTQSSEPERK
jgi:hypothetical protein